MPIRHFTIGLLDKSIIYEGKFSPVTNSTVWVTTYRACSACKSGRVYKDDDRIIDYMITLEELLSHDDNAFVNVG